MNIYIIDEAQLFTCDTVFKIINEAKMLTFVVEKKEMYGVFFQILNNDKRSS